MKKLVRITALLFLLATLFSCNIGTSYKESNSDSAGQTDQTVVVDKDEGVVTVSIPSVNLGRAVYTPDTSVYEDYSFVLSGYYNGSETLTVIKKWSDYESLIGSEFVIKKGSWNFILTANQVDYVDDEEAPHIVPVLSDSFEKAITEPTALSFNLNPIENCELDGNYSFTLDFPKSEYWTISAFIKVPTEKGLETLEYNPDINKTSDSVTLSGSIPAGDYALFVKFVYSSPTLKISSPSIVPLSFIIASGCMTTNTERIYVPYRHLNMQIPINYVGLDEYELPSNYPVSFDPNKSVALPEPTKSGCEFGGWFTSGDLNFESKISETPVVSEDSEEDVMQELVLFPKWIRTSSSQFSLRVEDGENAKGITFVISEETKDLIKDPETGTRFRIINAQTGKDCGGAWVYYKEFAGYGYEYNMPFVNPDTEYECWIEFDSKKTDILSVTPTTGMGEIEYKVPKFEFGDDGILHVTEMGEEYISFENEDCYHGFQIWTSDWSSWQGEEDIRNVTGTSINIDMNRILKENKLYGKDIVLNTYYVFRFNDVKYELGYGNYVFNVGNEIQNYLSDYQNTNQGAQISYITANATDRGIEFETTVLVGTAIKFSVKENNSGISEIRNWKKESDWSTCKVIYPFVDEGKEYSFYVEVTQTDHTLYKGDFTVTAKGGLGEYRVENVDDFDIELTDDRVIQLTGEPEFTNNDNVKLVDKGFEFVLTRTETQKFWGEWVWGQQSWLSSSNGTASLLDESDGTGYKWRNPEQMNNWMLGYNYGVNSYSIIKVAGYTDNGETCFYMNDYKEKVGKWGGEKPKVYIVYGLIDETYGNIDGLPGEKMTFTIKDEKGNEESYELNASIVDWSAVINEPLYVPYYTTGKSQLNYWINEDGYRINFPTQMLLSSWKNDDKYERTISVNGENVEYIYYMVPCITGTFTATMMSGDEVIGKTQFVVTNDRMNGGLSEKETSIDKGSSSKDKGYFESYKNTLDVFPEKDNSVFTGWYLDEECTIPFSSNIFSDVTVYAKFDDAEEIWSGDDSVVTFDRTITIGNNDSLYFEIYCNGYKDGSYGTSIRASDYRLGNYSISGGETKILKYVMYSGVDSITFNTLEFDYYYNYFKRIYLKKGPRVNISIYDGENLLQKIEAIPDQKIYRDSIMIDNGIIEGLYTDSDLSIEWDGYAPSEDINIYAEFTKTETLWTGSKSSGVLPIDSSRLEDLDVGDILYFTVDNNYEYYKEDYYRQYFGFGYGGYYDYRSYEYEFYKSERTKIIQYKFTEDDLYLIENIKNSGLAVYSVRDELCFKKVDYVGTKKKLALDGIYFSSDNGNSIRFYANDRNMIYNNQYCKYLVDSDDSSIFNVLFEDETIATLKYELTDDGALALQELDGDGSFIDIGTWEKKKVNVTLMDGETELGTVEVYVGTNVSVFDTPTKDDYNFVAWYVDEGLSARAYEVTEDFTTLYAYWIEKGVLFDPKTYKGDIGEVVELNGEYWLKVSTYQYETMVPMESTIDISMYESATGKFFCADDTGISQFAVQLMHDGQAGAFVSNPAETKPTEVSTRLGKYFTWIDYNNNQAKVIGSTCFESIQVWAQDTSYEAVDGAIIYIGKITAK